MGPRSARDSYRPAGGSQPEEQSCTVYLYLVISHPGYAFTYTNLDGMVRYALAAATSVMMWMVVKKPPADIARRVRQNKEWS